jgi:RNA polymerase sigma-70 factor, ECF subfamily
MTRKVEMDQEKNWDSLHIDQLAKRDENGQAPLFNPNFEATLIPAAQKGDLSAFNLLVLGHQGNLFRWVFYLVHDIALADDITQATFVAAYEKMHTFRGRSFRAWLYRIARNRSYDEMRRRMRHPTVSLDADMRNEDEFGLHFMLPSHSPSPEEVLIRSEETGRILRLLDNLPEPYKQALALVDLHEMDYMEAAGVLDLPLGTLKSRVARARLKLRDEIMAL